MPSDFLKPQKGKREAFQEVAIEQMTATYNILLALARKLKFTPKEMVELMHEYIQNDNYARLIQREEEKYLAEKRSENLKIEKVGLFGKIKKLFTN